MKISINNILFVFLIATLSCNSSNTSTVENEEENTNEDIANLNSTYGEVFDPEEAVDINSLHAVLGDSDSMIIKLTGTINSTCAAKGCWMKMDVEDKEQVRVSFKDYGFFVPTSGVEGKRATINGYAKKVVTDVETLKHYAQDAGKSQEEIDAITEPKEEISFVASGVIIEEVD